MGRTTLFLCGDLMLGRGVDQLLPRSVDPRLHETFVEDARRYVELAEAASGSMPDGLGFGAPWGDALEELERVGPDVRIANLETAVTAGGEPWPGKGIHYRMHPGNVPVLGAAGIDVCVLANNHVLDWGYGGLTDTLAALGEAGVATAGAGPDEAAATAPAVVTAGDPAGGERPVRVFAFGLPSAGVPRGWAVSDDRPGVALLRDLDGPGARRAVEHVRRESAPGDVVVVSLHWGANWGHRISDGERAFAHRLVEEAGADVVHGHSSHHPKAVELHRGRPILYGCGDFLNDYEGISGHEEHRPELTAMYFVAVAEEPPHRLAITPMRIRGFRARRTSDEEARWLAGTLDRESRERCGTRIEPAGGGRFVARADQR